MSNSYAEGWYADKVKEQAARIEQLEAENKAVRQAIEDYRAALNRREHGGVAASEAIYKIEAAIAGKSHA